MKVDPTQLNIASHYHESYFNSFQKEIGEFGGKANKFLFEEHVSENDTVLDFGCGGGFLLKNLDCRDRIGVELNPIARSYCNEVTGIKCVKSLKLVPDQIADVAISSHCLEHTPNPVEIVSQLYKKLKYGGKIVIVVPLDSYRYRWAPFNINNHLYSFSPMNLGNILQSNGFLNIHTEPVFHKWVPMYKIITNIFGLKIFHKLSWLYGSLAANLCVQVKGVAIKKVN